MSKNVDNKLLQVPEIVVEKLPFILDSNWKEPNMLLKQLQKYPKIVIEKIDIAQITPACNKEQYCKLINKFHIRDCVVKVNRDNLEDLQKEVLYNRDIFECKFNPNKLCKSQYSIGKSSKKRKIACKPNKHVHFSEVVTYHDEKDYYKCRKCVDYFKTYKELKEHKKLMHKKSACYICFYCEKVFIERIFFKFHIKLHCGECGILCINKDELQIHKNNCYNCKDCGKNFNTIISLNDHYCSNRQICYNCNQCSEKFESKCFLSYHVSIIHKKEFHKELFNKLDFKCRFCEYVGNNLQMIKTHVSKLNESSIYQCDQCTQRYKTETDLIKHKWTHYLKSDKITSRNNSIQININEDIKLNGKLKPVVLLKRIYFVDNTNPRIGLQNSYINVKHKPKSNNYVLNDTIPIQKMNTPEKKKKITRTYFSKYQCHVCSKYYSSNYCLNRHIESLHTYPSLKKYQCNYCGEILGDVPSHICPKMPSLNQNENNVHPVLLFDNYGGVISFEKMFQTYPPVDDSDTDDFEMIAPIVELTEYDSNITCNNDDLNVTVNGPNRIEPRVNNNCNIST